MQHQEHHASTAAARTARSGKSMRIASVVLLVAVALLIAMIAVYVGTAGNSNEDKFVDKSKYQAVFLNNGQVYFGKLQDLNSKYLTMNNIYYLRVSQQVQPKDSKTQAQQDVSLAKLGCELHGPSDQMVINRDQITFWENLKDDGQVAKAITEYRKQNPNGTTCQTTNNTSNSNTNTTNTTPAKSNP